MRKKLFIVILSLAMILSACSSGSSKKDGKTLNVAVAADATSLDPISYNDDFSENVMKQIFQGLLAKTADNKIVNCLAQSIEKPDDLTFIIKIKDGVKFSNGDDLTVDDVIFSLDRVAGSDQYGYVFQSIDRNSFEKIDDKTFKFKLKEADATIMEALAGPSGAIVQQKDVEAKGEKFAQEPMGTGPFKIDSWTKLDTISLSKNENYWQEAPKIDKIVLRVVPEASQRLIELESGNVDIAYQIAPNDIKKVEENPDLSLMRRLDNSVHFISLNVSKPPFDNIKAREAMDYALDMETIFNTVFMGVGKLATSPVNPNFSYSIADQIQPIKQDKEKAKELFAEAGVKPGTLLKIYVNENQQRNDVAAMMQEQLKEYGIDLQIVKLEWGAMVEALKAKEDDMFIMSWSPSAHDTHYEFFSPYHSNKAGQGPNYSAYTNPEMDKLIIEGLHTTDENKRAEIYKAAQELAIKDKPYKYIHYGETVVGIKNTIEGFELLPTYAQNLWNVSFKESK